MSRAGALPVLLGLFASGAPALAAAPPPAPEVAPAPEPAGWPAKYPRFRLEEYGVGAAALTALVASTLLVPEPPSGFRGEWPVDNALRDLLRAEDPDHRERLSLVSDVLQNVAILAPIVVDIGLGALLLRRDLDVALEMALIDMEVLLVTSSLVMLTKRTIGRVRPNVPSCADGGYDCRSNASRRAFLSGHATSAFAAAGLSCAHHQYLELFGGLGDDLMCAGMLSLATAAGALRIASDRHWASDTIVGAMTGLFSGYALPYLLHYQGPTAWPGRDDGELDGSLQLSLLGGVTSGERAVGAAVGVEAAGRFLYSRLRPVRLEATTRGRLLYDSVGFAVRDYLAEGRVWLGPVGLGGAARYRAADGEAPARTGWSGGATLSVGTFDEAQPWLLCLRWLPAGVGRLSHVSGRLEWAPHPAMSASVEVSPVVVRGADGGEEVGAEAMVGLGGRLPW